MKTKELKRSSEGAEIVDRGGCHAEVLRSIWLACANRLDASGYLSMTSIHFASITRCFRFLARPTNFKRTSVSLRLRGELNLVLA